MSYSQIGQENWVLENLKYKTGGFFLEAGACDGIDLSNTYFLEKKYGWNGICAEPNPNFYNNLVKNRSCITTDLCLYSKSDEEKQFSFNDGLGGLVEHFNEPTRTYGRTHSRMGLVKTITMTDLFDKYNAPSVIDYISLDTEGTELEILKTFDFNKYKVLYFTIEHNSEFRADGTSYLHEIIDFMRNKRYQEYIVKHDVWFKYIGE
jgi:FkbM family methyltransferase